MELRRPKTCTLPQLTYLPGTSDETSGFLLVLSGYTVSGTEAESANED